MISWVAKRRRRVNRPNWLAPTGSDAGFPANSQASDGNSRTVQSMMVADEWTYVRSPNDDVIAEYHGRDWPEQLDPGADCMCYLICTNPLGEIFAATPLLQYACIISIKTGESCPVMKLSDRMSPPFLRAELIILLEKLTGTIQSN